MSMFRSRLCVCVIHILCIYLSFLFFFSCYGDHRDLHVLTHSFPTRRSSDLPPPRAAACRRPRSAGRHRCAAPTAAPRTTPNSCSWSATVCPCRRLLPVRSRRNRSTRSPIPRPASCRRSARSEGHTSELQSLLRISYAVFCLKQKLTQH